MPNPAWPVCRIDPEAAVPAASSPERLPRFHDAETSTGGGLTDLIVLHRIWKAHSLKPHRVETFKFSTDPQAEDKIFDVVLYLNPPDNAVVLSVDEKTQIQALSRTQPLLPLRPGLPARQTHDYRRNGLTSLYAALEVATGTVVGECSARHTGTDFLRFIKRLATGNKSCTSLSTTPRRPSRPGSKSIRECIFISHPRGPLG